MKHYYGLAILTLSVIAMSCTNVGTSIYRSEQTAVDMAHAGYVAWTNYYMLKTNTVLSVQAQQEDGSQY